MSDKDNLETRVKTKQNKKKGFQAYPFPVIDHSPSHMNPWPPALIFSLLSFILYRVNWPDNKQKPWIIIKIKKKRHAVEDSFE